MAGLDSIMSMATGNPLGMVSGVLGILSGGQSLFGGSDQAQSRVDPYAPYRAGAAQQLQNLMANPSSVTSLPGFSFMQAQGQQGVERAMAARGLSMSTNEKTALMQQDQKLANDMYNQEFNKLATLSGANVSPAVGGSAFNTERQAGFGAIGQGLGALNTIYQATPTSTGGGNLPTFQAPMSTNETLQQAFGAPSNTGYQGLTPTGY